MRLSARQKQKCRSCVVLCFIQARGVARVIDVIGRHKLPLELQSFSRFFLYVRSLAAFPARATAMKIEKKSRKWKFN